MNEPAPISTPVPRRRSHFKNWISFAGAILALGALFSFALLVWMDFTSGDKNPYLGILTYIVAPGFLIAGFGIILFGAWLHRRHARRHAPGISHFWSIDLDRPRDRRNLVIFGTGATVFFLISAFGSYQTYHYSESTQFCGQVCHVSMGPEFTAYQRMSHADRKSVV